MFYFKLYFMFTDFRYNMCGLQDSSVSPDIVIMTGENDIITNFLPPFISIHGYLLQQ